MEITKNEVKSYEPSIFIRFFYRTTDICIGLVGCLFTVVIFFITKIAYIKDGDKNPIIFTQKRIGKDGKLFEIYKIRTMVPNADEILKQLLDGDENLRLEYKKNKKLEHDPRVTRIGDKLRRASLDEFPQFFNVLIGNMTLVGPRPYLPREMKDMGEAYFTIIQCKPAITGPWQVSGRNNIDFKDRCMIDIEYVNNKSIKRDIEIFIRTINSVVNRNGAK